MPGDLGSIPGLGRFPREGNSNPLQYSCLENPMDVRAWWATVHGLAESDTTEWLHFHFRKKKNLQFFLLFEVCVLHFICDLSCKIVLFGGRFFSIQQDLLSTILIVDFECGEKASIESGYLGTFVLWALALVFRSWRWFSKGSANISLFCVTVTNWEFVFSSDTSALPYHIPHLACSVYHMTLKDLPAMVRLWWNSSEKRVFNIVDRFTSKYVSSVLSFQEISSVQTSTQLFNGMTVSILNFFPKKSCLSIGYAYLL